jgi:hypothetical protein
LAKAVDVERTIQFILESQAKAEARMGVIDGRMDSITKLIKRGLRLLVTFQTETTSKFNALVDSQAELAEAQEVTELQLQLLFDTLRKNRNGDN